LTGYSRLVGVQLHHVLVQSWLASMNDLLPLPCEVVVSAEGSIQTLENSAHFLGIGLFLLEPLVFFVVDDVLLHPVFELVLIFVPFDVAFSHNSHDLLVVVEDRKAGEFRFVVQKCLVSVVRVLEFVVGVSETRERLESVHG